MPDRDETYQPGGASFFGDLLAAAGLATRSTSMTVAQERLREHSRQTVARVDKERELAVRSLEARGVHARFADQTGQSRALSNLAAVGGEFFAPKYLVDQFASIARAACPLKRLMARVDLPPDCLELHVPRFDAAGGVIPQEYENENVADVATGGLDEITAKVATFAGDVLVSQQLYDRGGSFSDTLVLKEFAGSYAESLQQQLMFGSGQNGQILGLTNVVGQHGVPGPQLVTYTASEPTVPGLVKAVAQCAGKIADTRKRPPSAIFMRGGRWFDIAGTPDKNEEPTVRPGTGLPPSESDTGPYGPLLQVPVYLDATIPNDLGASANQDEIVMARTSDSILLEDPIGPRFTAMPGANIAGELTVILAWHHYTAALTSLYPQSIGTVVGTGLAYPAGY